MSYSIAEKVALVAPATLLVTAGVDSGAVNLGVSHGTGALRVTAAVTSGHLSNPVINEVDPANPVLTFHAVSAGSAAVNLVATDSVGAIDVKNITVTINRARSALALAFRLLVLTCCGVGLAEAVKVTPIPDDYAEVGLTFQVSAVAFTGGTGSYTLTVAPSTGDTYFSAGDIMVQGLGYTVACPVTAGSGSLDVTITDSLGSTDTKSFVLNVEGESLPCRVLTCCMKCHCTLHLQPVPSSRISAPRAPLRARR